MVKFDKFLKTLKKCIVDLAKNTLSDFKDQAIDDASSFLTDTKDDLNRWTKLLARGQLTKDEFTFLMKSKKDLFELHALTQSGVALITIQKFRDAVIDLVVNTAVDVFL